MGGAKSLGGRGSLGEETADSEHNPPRGKKEGERDLNLAASQPQ